MTDPRIAALCDICVRRVPEFTVPVFKSAGGYSRDPLRTEHWCRPCHNAVVSKYPGEALWPPFGVWLRPEEVPA